MDTKTLIIIGSVIVLGLVYLLIWALCKAASNGDRMDNNDD
jgi:hypothetical protein